MSMHPQFIDFMDEEIPELTVEIAKAAFPKGNRYMQMRDELGVIYDDELFADLYPKRGQPAICPWRLALITVMQFSENLTDRQAADAVRGRIDWKYSLGLELTDSGFDFSVLSEFRSRLLEGNAETRLLDRMLTLFQERDLLKKEKQRTDATHIVAAVRELNRLEIVGETLRAALNSIAVVAPNWLRTQVSDEWFKRYSQPIVDFRLPKEKADRLLISVVFGQDGHHLLNAIYGGEETPDYLVDLPAVQILRQVWVQNFFFEPDGTLAWRTNRNFPPSAQMIASPYDTDSRYSMKRGNHWRGYKVHLTETVDEEAPNLITHVHTTVATVQDVSVVKTIHNALEQKQMTPSIHLVDGAYISSGTLVDSNQNYGTELLGPARLDKCWQARSEHGYDQTTFTINWENESVVCPQGKQSRYWKPEKGPRGKPTIQVSFDKHDCASCPVRSHCTKSVAQPRTLTLHPQPQHIALRQRRDYQKTIEFKERYKQRSGIEGTVSNAVFTLGMRRTRYRGLTKTHLQHVATAAAINLHRVLNWMNDIPRSKTPTSHFGRLAVVS